jgi:RNA polymerase sigma-70 factor (ECF subfamily)
MVGEVTIFPAEPATVTVPPTPSAAEDLDLLRQAARGDGQAFHKLVDRHGQSLYRLAVSLAGNSADAEDLVQECLAGAFRGLDRFEGRSSVKTWLTRILVTQVARWRRSRRGKTALSIQAMDSGHGGDNGGETADWVGASSGTDPADHVGRQVDVQAALRTLSAEHREVLVLREFQGLAYEEIAEVLGVPRGTVESRLHRARAELRGRLKSYLP